MADFHQSGVITTLHRLGAPGVERLERELLSYSRSRPIALVLPCLISELRGDGLKGIVDILRGVRYLRQIVVSISGSEDRADYEEMRRFWDGVSTIDGESPVLLWNSGPRVEGLFQQLRDEGLDPGANGKGRAHLDRLRLRAGQQRLARDRGARLRHPQLQPRAAGAPLLPDGQPEPPLRVRQGLLRARQRAPLRAGHAALRDAAAQGDEGRARVGAAARLLRFVPLPARRRVLDDDRPGAHEPHSERLGARGRDAGRGLSQLLAQAHLSGGAGRELRPQAPGSLGARRHARAAPHGRRHRSLADPQPRELRRRVRRGLPPHADRGLRAHGPGRDRLLQRRRAAQRSGLRSPRGGARRGDLHTRDAGRRLRLRARSAGQPPDPELEPRDLGAAGLPGRAARGRRSRRRRFLSEPRLA